MCSVNNLSHDQTFTFCIDIRVTFFLQVLRKQNIVVLLLNGFTITSEKTTAKEVGLYLQHAYSFHVELDK